MMEEIIALIESLKLSHYECEDRWYSCPKSEEGTFNEFYNEDECNCGADEHNKTVDEVIKLIGKLFD